MIFDIFKKKQGNQPQKADLNEIKKRSKILVIDDKDFEYKPLFEKDGYTITKWTINEDIDQEKIDSCYYDIILLDVDGVATDRSDKHGLGLLEYIKSKYPAQIVIIYSANNFGMDDHKYIRLADDFLRKSADYYDFKKKVDTLLESHANIAYYLGIIKNIIPAEKYAPHIDAAIEEAIKSGKNSTLRQRLEDVNLTGDLLEKIICVVTIGAKFLGT